METKVTFSPAQFVHQNEPKIAALIGNISISCAAVAAAIIGFPATLTACGVQNFVLPPAIEHVATVCLVIGAICKAITKMFGTVDASTGTPVNTTLPPVTK